MQSPGNRLAFLDPNKHNEIAARTPEFMESEASKPFGWGPLLFVHWATIEAMLGALDVPEHAAVLDIGCGPGWTSLFLAEAGYRVTGYDLVPANVEPARRRAEQWRSSARFEVADMESLPPGEKVDLILIYAALHHSARQEPALHSATDRLRPDGWLLISEPSWVHWLSPRACAARRELGWVERGVGLRRLRRDLRNLGYVDFRRFYQPTHPYQGRLSGFLWQLARLGANVLVAPRPISG